VQLHMQAGDEDIVNDRENPKTFD